MSLGERITRGRFKANRERKTGTYRRGVFLVWDALFCALKIDYGLEARLGLMLYLCSKVACFPHNLKDFSGGEGLNMYL